MNITITGNPEPEALGKACVRAFQIMGMDSIARIHCFDRQKTGWLEYSLALSKPENQERIFHVGLVQRSVGAEYEFHS